MYMHIHTYIHTYKYIMYIHRTSHQAICIDLNMNSYTMLPSSASQACLYTILSDYYWNSVGTINVCFQRPNTA